MEILAEKGPLPVGEVGKMLQEATSMSALSAQLKEKFGGLKKFLEGNPDDFILRYALGHRFLRYPFKRLNDILIVFSNDHPFNPHVYLKRPVVGSSTSSPYNHGVEENGTSPLKVDPHGGSIKSGSKGKKVGTKLA
jgi:hypothetical protein